MKYRYVEFTDRTAASARGRKHGSLYYAGIPSEELIEELGITVIKSGSQGKTLYETTLQAMGERGWELQFVTPCGIHFENGRTTGGPIENSYIFRKNDEISAD